MPEAGGANIEIAKHLSEHEERRVSEHVILEIVEALVLAIVAIATAWSGYQAALWTGHQSELYGQASKLRVQAEGAATYANQERLYNASTVVEWLKAEAHDDKKLTDLFERRFLPEFRPAFEAWKKTDPLNNPSAPAGPQLMAEYRSSKTEEAARLNNQATEVFEQGTKGREYADQYVRATVTLATVLLLIAISQRFKTRRVRVGLLVIAMFLLLLSGLPYYYAAPSIVAAGRPEAEVSELNRPRLSGRLAPSSSLGFVLASIVSDAAKQQRFADSQQCLSICRTESVVNESLFYRTNEMVINWAFFALMLTATEVGFRLGRKSEARTPESIKSQIFTVEAGILGILALLLGFTMSMAVSRFEIRKQLVLEEADAIGTASSSCATSSRRRQAPRSRVFLASMSMSGCSTGPQEMISRGSKI